MTGKRRGVEAVTKTIAIVDELATQGRARVTELAADVELPASTVHNHLSTLVQEGLVAKEGDFYHLSATFLKYGNRVKGRRQVYELADTYLDQLVESTDLRAVFIIEEHGYGVFLHMRSGEHAKWDHYEEGEREYLHLLAAGKAIMSELPESRVDEIIDRHGLPGRTSKSITDRDDLIGELAEIRETGVAVNVAENMDNVTAIGAPITDSNGRVLGGMSLSGATYSITEARLEGELKNALLGTINELELEHTLA